MDELCVEVSGIVHAPVERVFDLFMPIDLRSIMSGFGPLPAVVGIEDQVGAWDAVGQTRRLRLADGNSLREEITFVDRPHHFAYQIDELTGPLGRLVTGMRGGWWFEPDDAQRTHALWRYVFIERSALTRPFASLVVRAMWRPYMKRALGLATRQAES